MRCGDVLFFLQFETRCSWQRKAGADPWAGRRVKPRSLPTSLEAGRWAARGSAVRWGLLRGGSLAAPCHLKADLPVGPCSLRKMIRESVLMFAVSVNVKASRSAQQAPLVFPSLGAFESDTFGDVTGCLETSSCLSSTSTRVIAEKV